MNGHKFPITWYIFLEYAFFWQHTALIMGVHIFCHKYLSEVAFLKYDIICGWPWTRWCVSIL